MDCIRLNPRTAFEKHRKLAVLLSVYLTEITLETLPAILLRRVARIGLVFDSRLNFVKNRLRLDTFASASTTSVLRFVVRSATSTAACFPYE